MLKNPKKALIWYAKTRFIGVISILMFLVLFILFYIILPINIWYINVGISLFLSFVLTASYFQYYNKRFIKEWKETKNTKSANKTAFIFILIIIIYSAISILTKTNELFENIIGIVLTLLFLWYIYIRFLKE